MGVQIGVSRERIRQIAKEEFGITGRTRHKSQLVHTARRVITPRKPCPRCGYEFAEKRGPSKLGAIRMLCICGKSFIAGKPTRPRIAMGYEFYRRIGQLAAKARWGAVAPLRLNYPYMPNLPSDEGGEIVQAVNSIIPRGLYDDCRADICQDMILAILEGQLERTALSKETANNFISRWFRQRGRDISLNAPRYGGDKTFGELLGVY